MKIKSKEVRIETTTNCNARCVSCPREKFSRPREVMSCELFADVIISAATVGAEHINLNGFGEPLTDPNIVERVEVCSAFCMESHITTNASLLTESLSRDLVAAGLDHIRFSVHGFGQEYEQNHRGLKWEKTRNNIVDFLRINDGKVETSVVSLSTMSEYSPEVIAKYWQMLGVDHVEVWRPHNWTNGRNYRPIKVIRRKLTCGRPYRGPIQILVDGSVAVCCFDYNGEMTVGNIDCLSPKSETLEDVIKGAEFEAIRERHRRRKLSGLICDRCDQLNIEDESPLLFSTRDPERKVGRTSSIKFDVEGG